MGSQSEGDHNPAHKVRVDTFYIDKYEVTNAQYHKFVEETGARLPEFWGMKKYRSGPEFPKHPVIGVSWPEAVAYAEWAGKRLPTEAEWEYAARGGLVGKEYPRGNELKPEDANRWRWETLSPSGGGILQVGQYPPNGYGLHDMAGNVAEWVADYYADDYYKSSPAKDPRGPAKGKFRVFRGGGWHSGPSCNRVYYRNALPPQWRDFNVGFRCVKDVAE
jgi:iron(II)-dependent oxidoreductase